MGKVYYLLYANNHEMPSKVAFDVEEPSLGRIRVDSVAPPHSPTSIKRCISRVEGNPAFAFANLFANMSSDAPLREGHISLLRTDDPGLSPDEPMAIVQRPPIPDGRYLMKNRAADIYWLAGTAVVGPNPITAVYFYPATVTVDICKTYNYLQVNNLQLFKCSKVKSLSKWDITHNAGGNISMTSQYSPSSSWVGANIAGSTAPVPWRLIPAARNSYS